MSFDQLKREAVHLERQLEDKISRYQQLAQKIQASGHDLSLTEEGRRWDEESTLQSDITRNLTQLSEIISKLPQTATTHSQEAIITRYKDILLDLRRDWDRASQTVARAKERSELLGGASKMDVGSGNDAGTDHLLRERSHINNSLNAAGNVIGQADAIRADLRMQGRSIRNAGSMLTGLASNIPGINQLISQIGRKRSKDDKIVAGVIASCILFTLWYLFGG